MSKNFKKKKTILLKNFKANIKPDLRRISAVVAVINSCIRQRRFSTSILPCSTNAIEFLLFLQHQGFIRFVSILQSVNTLKNNFKKFVQARSLLMTKKHNDSKNRHRGLLEVKITLNLFALHRIFLFSRPSRLRYLSYWELVSFSSRYPNLCFVLFTSRGFVSNAQALQLRTGGVLTAVIL